MKSGDARRGEAGFTVLEAAIALALTLGVALAALEAFQATRAAALSAKAHGAARAAAQAALARVGADLPAAPGVWESASGVVTTRIVLEPFAARAQKRDVSGLGDFAEELRDTRRRSLRGAPLLATATAAAAFETGRARREVVVRLSRIVIGAGEGQ